MESHNECGSNTFCFCYIFTKWMATSSVNFSGHASREKTTVELRHHGRIPLSAIVQTDAWQVQEMQFLCNLFSVSESVTERSEKLEFILFSVTLLLGCFRKHGIKCHS